MRFTGKSFSALVLLLLLVLTGASALAFDFEGDMKSGQAFNEGALQAIGKTWAMGEFTKWVNSKELSAQRIADIGTVMGQYSANLGPLVSYTKARRSNLLHHMNLGKDVVTCESNFDLQCKKGKATARLVAVRPDSTWYLMSIDIDSPLLHQGAQGVTDQRAVAFNDKAVMEICQSWSKEKLLQYASPELRAVLEKDPASGAVFVTYRTMLGGVKSRQQTKLVTSAIQQGKYFYAFETPFQFERTQAQVQTQIIGDKTGWHMQRFNIHVEMGGPPPR